MSSQSSHHPQEVLLARFSLYVHKGGLKPDSFHFYFEYLCYESMAIIIFKFFKRGDRFQTSESDVYGRQILTYKDGPVLKGLKRCIQ